MIGEPDPGLCGFASATGFRCAEALGLDASRELGDGFDGRAYALDGPGERVLKLSRRPGEAALAALLLAEGVAGHPVPGFPEILAVARLDAEGVHGPLWAIVREPVAPLSPDQASAVAGPDLTALSAGLARLRDRHGLAAPDLARSAFGKTRDGRLVLRDFGRVSGPPAVIGRLLDGLPPPVPVPIETLAPTP